MAKRMTKKSKTKKTKTTKRAKPIRAIAKPDKRFVLRAFTSGKWAKVAVQSDGQMGYNIVPYHKGVAGPVSRHFAPPAQSEIPLDMWMVATRELAVWYARHLAHHHQPPSTRQERSRRRSIWKKYVLRHQAHMQVKSVVRAVHGDVVPTEPRPKDPLMTYVIVYDPALKLGDAFFRVHHPTCPKLDKERRRVHKEDRRGRRGYSWVVESQDLGTAVVDVVRELNEDNKGFEITDFEIHDCDQH